MQLVAYGAQDVYLTGNPQITFFKVVYRRHTNFSMEAISQTFNGTAALGNKVTATISRNGDLIHRMYVQCDITDSDSVPTLVKNVGHRILENVELEIGGQRIDKHYSQWLDIWAALTVPAGKSAGYSQMVDAGSGNTHYVPLQFWFCRNPGLALPLIALQYHEVKVNIQFASTSECGGTTSGATTTTMSNASLWVDYIYLDTDERRRFAQVSHEYLIEQLQFTGVESGGSSAHRLNFNHPIKELVWVNSAGSDWNVWKSVNTCKLQLNGHDRFAEKDGSYFSLVQPYQHHTNIPVVDDANANINVYSFALKPEDHQPSGTCNISRIDNATLNITSCNR